METHNMPEDNRRHTGQGLFPSAGAIKNSLPEDGKQKAEDAKDCNNLETMRLTLPPTAMEAIIAAQSTNLHIQEADSVSMLQNKDDSDNHSDGKLSSDDNSEEAIALQRDEERSVSKRKKKKHKHKHKHKKLKRHHRSESPPNVSEKAHVHIPTGAIFLEDIRGLQPEHAYHIDRKKNKDLWHYESVSSRHIAKYKNFSRTCLGSSHIRMEKKSLSKNKRGLDFARYFGKSGLPQVYCKGTALTGQESRAAADSDFIPFPKRVTSKDSKSEPNSLSYSCLDEATSLYIHGKGTDYSENAGSTTVLDKDFVMDEIFEKVRSFNQRTREEPGNVALWLEFVAFQDVVAQREKAGTVSQSATLKETYRPTKSTIDKKVAILEKAIESNTSSLELKLAQLELYQDIWETDKMEKAWEDLLFIHSGKVNLWQEYLTKQQCSSLHGFNVGSAVKRFHKCFQTLTSIMDGKVKVIHKESDMEEKTISLFAQYCNFLHSSGYTERAVGIYQALIEFNLYCPPSLNLALTKDRVIQFERFWESSVARFGEGRALGWAKWAEQITKGVNQPLSSGDQNLEEEEDAIILEQLPRSQTWVKMEQLREKSHFIPWRPDASKEETEDSAEDPERLVLFDDVSPSLFRLTKPDSCVRVVCLFLKFLGMPSAILGEKLHFWEQETGSSKFEQYSTASVVEWQELSQCYCAEKLDVEWHTQQQLVDFVSNVLLQAESYFSLSNKTFFTLLRLENEVFRHGSSKISEIASSSIKAIKKFGKGMLKESQNRNNLVLWDAYIRLLWACSDKIEETVSMIETAIAMFMGSHNTSDLDKKYGVCLLCLTYCQILLNFEPLEHIEATLRHSSPTLEDKRQVMACLGALIENKVFKPGTSGHITPAYILKIRSLYQRRITEYISQRDKTHPNRCECLCALTNCFAIFEFCTSNLNSASSVYDSTRLSLQKLEGSDNQSIGIFRTMRKQLYLCQMSFITNVMHISLIPRACLRNVIDNGLQEFPECSKLHVAFIKLEERSHIAGRLRQFYNRSLRNASTLTTPIFAAVSELSRHKRICMANSSGQILTESDGHDMGIVHRIRSVFEASLSHSLSSHSVLLWRLYLNFEFRYGAEKRAKGVLYRALQSCPWAKCIFMDGIALFGDPELQEMMDLMTEEEIRVRMPLEELDLLRTAEKEESENEREGQVKQELDNQQELQV